MRFRRHRCTTRAPHTFFRCTHLALEVAADASKRAPCLAVLAAAGSHIQKPAQALWAVGEERKTEAAVQRVLSLTLCSRRRGVGRRGAAALVAPCDEVAAVATHAAVEQAPPTPLATTSAVNGNATGYRAE